MQKATINKIFINFVDDSRISMNLITANLQTIIELCKKYRVKDLSVFGSILTDRFNDESDVDLLVNFEPHDHNNLEFDYFKNYWELQGSLEQLFNRKVDLIEDGNHLNPLFRSLVYKKKQLIYG